jgi:hypothetical protein
MEMRKEACAICGKIVYVEQGDAFEWDPGAIKCTKHDKFYCLEHKPCCAEGLRDAQCDGVEDEEDFEDDDESSFEDDENEDEIQEDYDEDDASLDDEDFEGEDDD